MKPAPNAPCPCGTGHKFKRCCRPILQGTPAPTPEALMRSRYTAYAAGDVRHIMATTHPDSPHRQPDLEAWAGDLAAFCQQTEFLRLQVQSTRAQGDQGWVQFVAQLSQSSQATEMQEHSHFLQVDGRWLYLSAVRPQE